jgi:tetratricopeptide (TPR) repeat protein
MAEAERRALEEVRTKTSPDEEFSMFFNKARTFLDLAGSILDARLAMAHGDSKLAIEYWEKAVRIQDGLNYGEPPEWFYPVRESLGATLFAAGQITEAEQVFREDLRRNPGNPRPLFGLMNCLKAQRNEADGAWVERQFGAAWKGADTELRISEL